jgi:hypothetical protein
MDGPSGSFWPQTSGVALILALERLLPGVSRCAPILYCQFHWGGSVELYTRSLGRGACSRSHQCVSADLEPNQSLPLQYMGFHMFLPTPLFRGRNITASSLGREHQLRYVDR